MSALLAAFKAGFEALPPALVDAQGLGEARRAALHDALSDGLPLTRSERWKYTSLRALAARTFALTCADAIIDTDLLDAVPAPRMVFVNGRYYPALSMLDALPAGLTAQPWSELLQATPSHARADGEHGFSSADDVFARLNTALATDGVRVQVAAGTEITEPLHLVFVGVAAETDLASHLQHEVELADNASLTLVEHHIAANEHRHLCNHLLRLRLGAGSRLRHARLQDESNQATLIARSDAVLADDADYRRLDLELGAALSRHELNVALQGQRASVAAAGALLAGGRRQVDTRLGIEHIGRDTRCDLRWRGLAGERGKLAFHGGILIQQGADGSDAMLSNKNLLLSDSAEIDTQPVLEIHADEVKAAHGATVGQLDPTALFYLRSRGIPAEQARALLTLAFCREVLATLDYPDLVALLSPRLEARLANLEALS